jgi:hypothetical protein
VINAPEELQDAYKVHRQHQQKLKRKYIDTSSKLIPGSYLDGSKKVHSSIRSLPMIYDFAPRGFLIIARLRGLKTCETFTSIFEH